MVFVLQSESSPLKPLFAGTMSWSDENGHTKRRTKVVGQESTSKIEKLIVRLAQENGRWGYGKIAGELIKLGLLFSESTIRNVLNRNGILPAPVRFG